MQLRDYQKKAVDAAISRFAEGENALIAASVGAGKSLIGAEICARAADNGASALVLHHSASLACQNYGRFKQLAPRHADACGLFSAALKQKVLAPVTFATVGSFANLEESARFDLVIVDEAHRINQKRGQFIDVINKRKVPVIGMTGTPWRGTIDKPVGVIYGKEKLFKRLDFHIGINELTEKGFLAPMREIPDAERYTGISKAKIDDEVEKGFDGEYKESSLQDFFMRETDALMPHFEKWTADRRSVFVFAPSVAFSKFFCERLQERNLVADHVDGSTPQEERDAILRNVAAGRVQYLVSVLTMTTGVDCPPVDCIVGMNPTQSSALYIQMAGRGLRTSPATGKTDCLLLDYSGWVETHGLPGDAGPPGYGKEAEAKKNDEKTCPKCWTLNKYAAKECAAPGCTHRFENERRVGFGQTDRMAAAADLQLIERLDVDEHVARSSGDKGYKLTFSTVRPAIGKRETIIIYAMTESRNVWARSIARSTMRLVEEKRAEGIVGREARFNRRGDFWNLVSIV